jgi:hypothetical protein
MAKSMITVDAIDQMGIANVTGMMRDDLIDWNNIPIIAIPAMVPDTIPMDVTMNVSKKIISRIAAFEYPIAL